MHVCIHLHAHIHTPTQHTYPTIPDRLLTDGEEGVKPPVTVLQPLDWVRSHKIYGWQAFSSFFMHSSTILPPFSFPSLAVPFVDHADISWKTSLWCWSFSLVHVGVLIKLPSWRRGKVHLGNVSIMYLIHEEIKMRHGGLRRRHVVGDISWWWTTVLFVRAAFPATAGVRKLDEHWRAVCYCVWETWFNKKKPIAMITYIIHRYKSVR